MAAVHHYMAYTISKAVEEVVRSQLFSIVSTFGPKHVGMPTMDR